MHKTERLAHTINGATELLQCGRSTIYELLKQRKLEGVKLGSRTLVLDTSIRELLASLPRVTTRDAA